MKRYVLAPMAGVSTVELVAAACEAGMLGSYGAGYLTGEQTEQILKELRELITTSYAINVFVPEGVSADEQNIQRAYETIRSYEERLGLTAEQPVIPPNAYEAQINAILNDPVPIVSFTFGVPSEEVVKALKAQGKQLIGTATSLEEVRANEAAGMDAIVVQGVEAGGHRGSFLRDAYLPLLEFIEQAKRVTTLPLIAAGGIASYIEVEACLQAGASSVQIGTGFLCATESGASIIHKQSLLESQEGDFVVTKAFSGKEARGIRNTFIEEMKNEVLAPYPIQHWLTSRLRKESIKQNDPNYTSMWSGERGHLAQSGTVQELLKNCYSE
ncbi:nitronate monooxygenase [Savagea sp. SN6]|uniref:Probable nitronate monooxygenase n=1 Tax=Savagea serpentis TaxID=2785297 RepID=A0A8J7KSP9_9BACL|nr:nitronate monooxygenase [Savagea serpentis]MBF4500799.1 nitronate monooxygenase [Savagea serpentis]